MDDTELEKIVQENERLRERVRRLEAERLAKVARTPDWTISFLERIPMGLVQVSTDGAVHFANSEAQRVLGLAFDELEDRYITDFEGATFHEDGSPCPVEDYPVTRCLVTGEPQPAQMVGVELRDGDVSWAIFTAMPTFAGTPPERTGALVAFVDVTEMQESRIRQREIEGQLLEARRLEAVGKLAGGVAHDFNNILAVISGMAFVLASSDKADPKDRAALDAISRSCRRGRDLVRNLLGFARKGTSERRLVALNGVVEEVASLLERTLPETVRIESRCSDEAPAVIGDPSEIATMLMNLCLNAADALEAAEREDPCIRVETEPCEDAELGPGKWVRLTVADNGCGIPPDVIDKVFEPFFTTKPFGKGTGLGLSMVYGTAQNHDGDVRIESEPGVGTTISVLLPSSEQVEEGARPRPPSSSGSLPSIDPAKAKELARTMRLNVLVVEDDVEVLASTRRLVETLGHEVVEADTGARAISVAGAGDPIVDAVLLDLRLPDMDGEAIFGAIRETRPEMPVILTSGYVDEAISQRLLDAGAVTLLPKPLDVEQLQSVLEAVVIERSREDC